MAVNIRKFLLGIGLVPVSSSSISVQGEMETRTSDGGLYYHNGTVAAEVLTDSNTVTVTNKTMDGGSNTFTNLPSSGITGQVSVAHGGTGASTLTAHGVLIGEGTSAVTATATGTSGQALLSGGSSADPAYGDLGVAHGGTGATTLTAHGVLLGEGTSAIVATAVGATGTVLHGNTGADPSFSAIVNADITNGTIDLTTKVTGSLPVTNGGTGDSTLTNHGVLLGQGTSAVVATSAGTSGQPLLSGGASADPAYGTLAIGAGGTGQTTKAAAFDALQPMTTGGDIIYGGSSGTGTRLANGSSGQVLTSNGGTSAPSWQAAGTASPLTTKGDVYVYSTTNARLPVGTDGQILSADSTQTTGLKWIGSTVTAPRSYIRLYGGNGSGGSSSGETSVGNFTTSVENVGTDITYTARTTTNGDKFTINTEGIYTFSFSAYATSGAPDYGITKNCTELSTTLDSLSNPNQILASFNTASANGQGSCSWEGHLVANDVIRVNVNGNYSSNNNRVQFSCAKVNN